MGICPRKPATPRSEVKRKEEDEEEEKKEQEKEEEEAEEASQINTSYLYLGEDRVDE